MTDRKPVNASMSDEEACRVKLLLAEAQQAIEIGSLNGELERLTQEIEAVRNRRSPEKAWEKPVPLESDDRVPFPTDALPLWMANWVKQIAEETQTPEDMAGVLSLSIIASTVAKKYKINVRGNWFEPLNLFTVVALPPGERKSAVFSLAVKPILDYEREHAREWKRELQMETARYEIMEKRLESAKKEAERDDAAMARVEELVAEFSDLKLPVPKRFFSDDITPEKLGSMLADQSGRFAIFSAEGGIFSTLAGRYTDGNMVLDNVLKGHAGDSMRIDRMGRVSDIVNDPALTIGLSIQPGVLEDLAGKKQFLDRGLVARFLYSIPVSNIGKRNVRAAAASSEVVASYHTKVRLLLERQADLDAYGEITPKIISLSEGARNLLEDYASEIEGKLACDGDLFLTGGWGSKFAGALARISGILHLAEYASSPSDAQPTEISVEEMTRTLLFADYFIAHVKVAFTLLGGGHHGEARKILAWITREKAEKFTKRQLHRAFSGHISKAEQLDPPLKLLEDYGYIRSMDFSGFSKKGRPSSQYLAHKDLL